MVHCSSKPSTRSRELRSSRSVVGRFIAPTLYFIYLCKWSLGLKIPFFMRNVIIGVPVGLAQGA